MACQHPTVFRTAAEIVDPDHTALVVIDVQNDFLHEDGVTARKGVDVRPMQQRVERLNAAIEDCRGQGIPVVYVREIVSPNTVLPNYLTRCGSFEACAVREGTWGAEFYGGLSLPRPGDPVVDKPSYDGFQDSTLDVTLRSRNIRTCLYAGFAANVCVEATARHGFVLGYYSVLLSDATDGDTPAAYQTCLETWARYLGPVLATTELAELWRAARVEAPAAG